MMMNFDALRTWEEVDLNALVHNFDAARKHIPQGVQMAAVIKADAYGHGAVRIARELSGRADRYAVATADEAVQLREAGIRTPVFLLSPTPEACFFELLRYDIESTVASVEEAEAVCAYAASRGKEVSLHIAVDTGMGRLGLPWEQAAERIAQICALPGGRVVGLFSHFAAADTLDTAYANLQADRFARVSEEIKRRGLHIPLLHISNSAALMGRQDYYDMVRQGVILYGLLPSREVDMHRLEPLQPVMSLKTHVTFLKTVPAGTPVSYGMTYVTQAPMRIATLAIGYADGLPRHLSNKGYVLLHGQRAPIVGRVCMDQVMVDVTHIPQVKEWDVATVIGRDGEDCITADDIAELSGTIGYEIVCLIAPRVPRVYIKNGEVDSVHRLI